MDAAILDSDILSELLKRRDAVVLSNASAYLGVHSRFAYSAFVRLEVRRGLLEKNAVIQLARFDVFCTHSLIFPVTDVILDRASVLWVDARRGGLTCGDADLIIASTALENSLVLVTGNNAHFSWIQGLRLVDWRLP